MSTINSLQNTAHFVMQSKGGAGKSVCSALLSQYFIDLLGVDNVMLIDTDPSNKTLGAFSSLNVDKVDVVTRNGAEARVNQSKFDVFINNFVNNQKLMVVDTGSGEFLAISSYLKANEMPEVLESMGKGLFIHCPVNFGQSEAETFQTLLMLSNNFKSANIVVWENEYFGEAKTTPDYKKLKNVVGVVRITKKNPDTDEKDFSNMLKNHLTFDDVDNSEDYEMFGFMQKRRITNQQKEIYDQLNAIFTE